MEVYVVYINFYYEGNSTELVGVYNDFDKALDKVNRIINDDIDLGYVLDNEELNGADKFGGMWRMFAGSQENWNNYYEIIMEREEVK